MRPRSGVSTYLQTFVLVGVVLAGAAAVVKTTSSVQSSASGPGVSVSGLTIRQGLKAAVVRFTVANVGSAQITSVVVLAPGLSQSAAFCYSLWDAATLAPLGGTCPVLAANPTTFNFQTPLQPGNAVEVGLAISGAPYVLGRPYTVIVQAVPAAQASAGAVAVPA